MRIISRDHDYYDTVLAHGRDEDVVFVRASDEQTFRLGDNAHIKELQLIKKYLQETTRWGSSILPDFGIGYRSVQNINARSFVVFFCGKVYPGFELQFSERGMMRTTSYYIYNEKRLDAAISQHTDNIVLHNSMYSYMQFDEVRQRMVRFIQNSGKYYDDVAQYLYEKKIAYCKMGKSYDYTNDIKVEDHPILKDLHFVSCVDPFTAFQEISMFIGNIPKPGNMMVKLTDKEELVKKGFDNKSFKKGPTKRRT